jgi:hypothetical protein
MADPHIYEVRPRKDLSVRRNQRRAAVRPAVVWRAKRNQQRQVSQPLASGNSFASLTKRAACLKTHKHAGDFKEWQRDQNVCDYRVSRLS